MIHLLWRFLNPNVHTISCPHFPHEVEWNTKPSKQKILVHENTLTTFFSFPWNLYFNNSLFSQLCYRLFNFPSHFLALFPSLSFSILNSNILSALSLFPHPWSCHPSSFYSQSSPKLVSPSFSPFAFTSQLPISLLVYSVLNSMCVCKSAWVFLLLLLFWLFLMDFCSFLLYFLFLHFSFFIFVQRILWEKCWQLCWIWLYERTFVLLPGSREKTTKIGIFMEWLWLVTEALNSTNPLLPFALQFDTCAVNWYSSLENQEK